MMRVVMLVGFVIMSISLSIIRPSLAQESENAGCWLRISNCLSNAGSDDEILVSCCPIIKQVVEDERECFCLARDTILQNATVASSFATIFNFCGISDSVEALCTAGSDDGSSSVPAASPDSSPPSSMSSPAPVNEPSTPSVDSTPTPETSLPLPESPNSSDSPSADDGNCWTRITDCIDSVSESEISQCCPIVKQEVSNETECFCAHANAAVKQDPSDAKIFSQYLALCDIPDSYDTLCSPKKSPAGKGVKSKSASINGSTNKIAYSVGLLPTSFLIFCVINFLLI